MGLSFSSVTLTDLNDISGQLVTTSGTVFGGTPLNLTSSLSVTTSTSTVGRARSEHQRTTPGVSVTTSWQRSSNGCSIG